MVKNEYLSHHGILGMKWGIRRTQKQLGNTDTISSSKLKGVKGNVDKKEKKPAIASMTLSELQEAVNRMNLEKQYISLLKERTPPPRFAKAKAFISEIMLDVGKKQIKNILNTQLEGMLKPKGQPPSKTEPDTTSKTNTPYVYKNTPIINPNYERERQRSNTRRLS